MRVPVSWLEELCPTGLAADELADHLRRAQDIQGRSDVIRRLSMGSDGDQA